MPARQSEQQQPAGSRSGRAPDLLSRATSADNSPWLPCHRSYPVCSAPPTAHWQYRPLTSGIRIRLTKPFRSLIPRGKTALGAPLLKSGLPKTSANHKSDGGSLQCQEPVSAAASKYSKATTRRLQSDSRDSGRHDADGFRQGVLVALNPCREENGRKTMDPRRLVTSKSAGPVMPGFNLKWFREGYAMISGENMERSARYRADLAAGGTAMTLERRRADTIGSGTPPGSRRRGNSLALQLARAAGGKTTNAQQDAYRCLPPGGNKGCRRTR